MQYKSLDFFRFIAALLVVAIHTQFLCEYEVGYYVRCYCRIAVPFFFVCTSFLFWRKRGSISKYTRRILLLYIVWLVIYSPYVYKTFFVSRGNLLGGILGFTHGLLFHNTFHASWYLMASVLAMNLVFYLSRYISNAGLLVIGILLYFTSLLSCSYHGLVDYLGFIPAFSIYEKLFVPSNSFIIAFVYIVIGKILSEGSIMSIQKSLLGSILSFILLGFEVYLTKGITRLTDAFILLPIFVFFFFQLLLNINDEFKLANCVCLVRRGYRLSL